MALAMIGMISTDVEGTMRKNITTPHCATELRPHTRCEVQLRGERKTRSHFLRLSIRLLVG
jgi:hypothetical protein